jgi:hypothetical protein
MAHVNSARPHAGSPSCPIAPHLRGRAAVQAFGQPKNDLCLVAGMESPPGKGLNAQAQVPVEAVNLELRQELSR